jgi:NADH-quinone oxidoreductase subunit H
LGLLQPIADALKLLTKEIISRRLPTRVCLLGPIMTIMPALAAWVVIPFGPMSRWPTSMPACCC